MNVLHKCDVRCCVNPNHLFLGTQKDNMIDRAQKGRHKTCGHRIITALEVQNIRAAHGTIRELAEKFGVDNSHINRIRRGLARKYG